MPYKHVLAAVDFSDESTQILEKARVTANSHSAKLSLIRIVRPLAHVYAGLNMALVANVSVSFEEEALKQASQQLQDIGNIHGVNGENVHVKIGNPAHEIRNAVTELEVDLIVMGTHGRHGLGRLLGSTTNAVLHGVGCDVLAVWV